jgi:amino acid permease
MILCVFESLETYPFFTNSEDTHKVRNIKIYCERSFIIIMIAVCTSIIPNFIDFLNIFGGLGTTFLGFILPPIFYLKFYGKKKVSTTMIAVCIIIFSFGVIGSVFSCYNSIRDLMKNH